MSQLLFKSVTSWITRIVPNEPYTKSKAFELSGDALSLSKGDKSKVSVEHFVGISPRRYRDIFEKSKKRRDDNNRVKRWQFDVPTPMVDNKTGTHTALESQTLIGFDAMMKLVVEGMGLNTISE